MNFNLINQNWSVVRSICLYFFLKSYFIVTIFLWHLIDWWFTSHLLLKYSTMVISLTSLLIIINFYQNSNCSFYGHFVILDFTSLYVIIEEWSVLRSICLSFYCQRFVKCHTVTVFMWQSMFYILRMMWSVLRSVFTIMFCFQTINVLIHLEKNS